MSAPGRILALLGLTAATGCASAGAGPRPAPTPAATTARALIPARSPACGGCGELIPIPPELTVAIETRLLDLQQRGGVCSRYGAVLEQSYRRGRITLRPYMWRVGGRLVSGEARPNGEMVLAREIDSLNVGVRTLDDVLWSVEHEAVHVALRISSGVGLDDDRVNRYVRACRSGESSG